jgi:hypothetical protein
MCERAIQAAVEAFVLAGQMRDDGRMSRGDFNEVMIQLADLTAGIIADAPEPHAAFLAFLRTMRQAALQHAARGGHA